MSAIPGRFQGKLHRRSTAIHKLLPDNRIALVSACRIRTCDFHRVNLATANTINNLHGAARNYKSLKRQIEHNKVSLIVHEVCLRSMPADDHLVGRKVLPRAEAGATCILEHFHS